MDNIDYIYVLDYSDCTICKIRLTKEEAIAADLDIEEVLKSHGVAVNCASWMRTNIDITEIIEI